MSTIPFLSSPLIQPTPPPSTKLTSFSTGAENPSETKKKIISLEMLGIDSVKALSLNPSLRSTPLSTINSTISFLLSKGLRRSDLPRIFGMCPSLLTADAAISIEPVFRFLSEDLGVPSSDFRRPTNKCPRLLTSSVPEQLRPALAYLRRLGITDTLAVAYKDPVLLVSNVDRTLTPKMDYLRSIGFDDEEVAEMVRRCPGLFTFSIENNFVPKMKYYVEKMEGNLSELKEFPHFFSFSLEGRIQPRYQRVLENGVEMPLAIMLKATNEEFERRLTTTKKGRRKTGRGRKLEWSN